MFNNINREQFNVDVLFSTIQTAAAFVATQALGALGQYTVKSQTAVLISATAALVAALAQNIFNKAYTYYAAIPFGIVGGLVAHKFFYPTIALQQVLDIKGVLVIAAVLATVKLIADNLPLLRRQAERVETEVESAALRGADRVLSAAEQVAAKSEEEVAKARARVQAKEAELEAGKS